MNIEEITQEASKIEGWFSLDEMRQLYPFVSQLDKDSLLVELGTYHGRSTMFFRLSNPDIKIITNDVCKNYDNWNIPEVLDQQVLLKGNIIQIAGDSHDVVRRWNMPIDFLFIDTRHDYNDTYITLNEWGKYVTKYIALHDYHSGFQGVVDAVSDYLKEHKNCELIDLKLGIALIKIN